MAKYNTAIPVHSFIMGLPTREECNERNNEQAHINHAPTLLESSAHNECKCHALVMGNLTENW